MKKKSTRKIKTVKDAIEVLKAKPVCKCDLKLNEKELLDVAIKRADFETKMQDIRIYNTERELFVKNSIMSNARENIIQMICLLEKQLPVCDENLVKQILNRSLQIIEETINPKTASKSESTFVDFKEDITLTADGIRKAIQEANVLDIIRNAKKNGWEIKISDDEVALFKDGKRIDGKQKDIFVNMEQPKTISKI